MRSFSLFSFFFSLKSICCQQCSEDGVCVVQDDVVIPKYANRDGRPIEAVDDCFDRHDQCDNFVHHGEC